MALHRVGRVSGYLLRYRPDTGIAKQGRGRMKSGVSGIPAGLGFLGLALERQPRGFATKPGGGGDTETRDHRLGLPRPRWHGTGSYIPRPGCRDGLGADGKVSRDRGVFRLPSPWNWRCRQSQSHSRTLRHPRRSSAAVRGPVRGYMRGQTGRPGTITVASSSGHTAGRPTSGATYPSGAPTPASLSRRKTLAPVAGRWPPPARSGSG